MKINHTVLAALVALVFSTPGSAQMKKPHEWKNHDEIFGVVSGLRHYVFDVETTASSAPANIFQPGDNISFDFTVTCLDGTASDRKVDVRVVPYGTVGEEGDIWRPVVKLLGEPTVIPVDLHFDKEGKARVSLSVPTPEKFGGYAVVFDFGGSSDVKENRLATSFVYAVAPKAQEMLYPRQALDDLGPDFLRRVGVRAIRHGIGYLPTQSSGYRRFKDEFGERMRAYADARVTVLLMFGEGGALMPLGTPRPHLDENGFFKRTKMDYVWSPQLDDDFKQFVKDICLEYGWPRGPITAVSLWNEPWEGLSISGWQADMPRYREIYGKMAEAVLEARKDGVDVLVGGGDSNSNAMDKFFGDGSLDMLPVFDFMSIHYQGMESPALYPEFINRRDHKGRVLIWDTESWVGNTDDRIGLVIAANRSAAYDRSMGIYGGYLQTDDFHTWSATAAICAVQAFIGERDFKRLLHPNGLPWVMLFDGYDGNADDGTAVVCGSLADAFGKGNTLFSSVGLKDGSMRLKAARQFRVYDFYGNEVAPVGGYYDIPLTFRGYYVRTDGSRGSFRKLEKALAQAEISGYEPVEIQARDMTAPVAQSPEATLIVTNILNRPVSGTLSVTLGALSLDYPSKLTLKPGETREVALKVTGGEPSADNTYPLTARFTPVKNGESKVEHRENLHCNVISRRSITVDGNLDDWQGALPQTVKSDGTASVTLTEAAWYPFRNYEDGADGMAQAYLAADDEYFYFAAKVADSTPNPGTLRFADRDDDRFFYPDTVYIQSDRAMHSAVGRAGNRCYLENTVTTKSIGVDLNLPTEAMTRASFYLPAISQHGLEVTVSDAETGHQLYHTKIDKIWNGAWLSLDLCGDVRVRFTAYGWWYTAKLERVCFDSTDIRSSVSPAARFVGLDFDTCDNFKAVYGASGIWCPGESASIESPYHCNVVEHDDFDTAVWPEGVRRFTYRMTPTLPDGTTGTRTDNILIAFNAIPIGDDGLNAAAPGTMPRYIGYKCTDYEYALNAVAPEYGGGTEIWRLLKPGMPRKHFYPRQGKSPMDGAVADGKLVVRREGNTVFTECAIPWSEIPDVRLALECSGKVKFSFRVNDDHSGACMELAKGRSVSKLNSRAFHPDWKEHWANEIEFGIEK